MINTPFSICYLIQFNKDKINPFTRNIAFAFSPLPLSLPYFCITPQLIQIFLNSNFSCAYISYVLRWEDLQSEFTQNSKVVRMSLWIYNLFLFLNVWGRTIAPGSFTVLDFTVFQGVEEQTSVAVFAPAIFREVQTYFGFVPGMDGGFVADLELIMGESTLE